MLDIHVGGSRGIVQEFDGSPVDVPAALFRRMLDPWNLVVDHHPEQTDTSPTRNPGRLRIDLDHPAEHLRRRLNISNAPHGGCSMRSSRTLFFAAHQPLISRRFFLYPLAECRAVRKMEGAEKNHAGAG